MSTASLAPTASPAERIDVIIHLLRQHHPDVRCELDHANALQLLVATILSAQCTDVRVNKVTPALFAHYPSALDLAQAEQEELEELIRSTGFYHTKAKNIQAAARRIVDTFGGEVPRTMDELLTLGGVARKTANVVLGVAYGIGVGIVVDTHVRRLANRLGLTTHDDPQKIEKDLMALVPQSDWIDFSHLLIFHGRRLCAARKTDCANCRLSYLCPSSLV